MVCDYRPLKEEKYRVRLTIGGDKLDYNNETVSPIATLIDTKKWSTAPFPMLMKGKKS